MANKNTGQKILKSAKQVIPGGNQLLSKRSEMFLPGYWPNYYEKAKGCSVWDLDHNHYFDFCGMGVTSCILGYANNFVDNNVIKAIKGGSMSSLNSLEEYELSKRLIDIHKWSSMVKFTKSGGEACSVAIRIARAYTGRDKVAICGYHGWHDWYLSLNLQNKKNLDSQLLPGLKTLGVPKKLINTTIPFYFNDIESFNKIIKKSNNLAAIIMEPMRDAKPNVKFLKHIKSVSKKIGAVLIFDEITSGFHDNFGGIHLKYKINPDLAIFGKAIANGYPIAAIIGKKKIMDICQDTFISSTMWTERIGFVASLATLKKMKDVSAQKKNIKNAGYLKNKITKIAKDNNLKIQFSGFESMPTLRFLYDNNDEIMTFFTQEMMKNGFLAGSKIVLSITHSRKIIDKYILSANKVFQILSKYLNNNKSLPLDGEIRHTTFKRLTK